MALGVTIAIGGTSYTLRAREAIVEYGRSPAQIGLPGATVLMLDLGIYKGVIRITGLVNELANVDATTDPSKDELEAVAKDWYTSTITLTILTAMVGGSDDTYTGKIQTFRFTKRAEMEDRWDFDLVFLVTAKS